jgi:hypothetical protein
LRLSWAQLASSTSKTTSQFSPLIGLLVGSFEHLCLINALTVHMGTKTNTSGLPTSEASSIIYCLSVHRECALGRTGSPAFRAALLQSERLSWVI